MARARRFFSSRDGRSYPRLRRPWRRNLKPGFAGETPFPVAKIDIVEPSDEATVETEALGEKVLELYRKLKRADRRLPPKVDRYLGQLGDLEMLADLIASTFVDDSLRRQKMLEESSLNQRLRLLITFLQDEIGSAAA